MKAIICILLLCVLYREGLKHPTPAPTHDEPLPCDNVPGKRVPGYYRITSLFPRKFIYRAKQYYMNPDGSIEFRDTNSGNSYRLPQPFVIDEMPAPRN